MDIKALEEFNIKEYYSAGQLAKKFSFSRQTIANWCREDKIKYVRIGKRFFIHRQTVADFLKENYSKIEKAVVKKSKEKNK